jgi:hypothetical protein
MLGIVAVRCENLGHLDEIGDGLRSHLLHDLSSMHLHRRFRKPGLCCHLLVHQPGRHQIHHLALARTQSLKQSAHLGCPLLAFPTYAITRNPGRDGVQYVLLAEWFRQEIDRTRLHRSHHHGNIGVSADEDDGDVDIRAGELGLKICARSAENKLTSCHATVRLPKSCAWVPTLIRLRLRQRAAVESSQNLGVVMTTLEMLFQNGHECLRSTQGTRRNFFEALPWSAPIDRLPNN